MDVVALVTNDQSNSAYATIYEQVTLILRLISKSSSSMISVAYSTAFSGKILRNTPHCPEKYTAE